MLRENNLHSAHYANKFAAAILVLFVIFVGCSQSTSNTPEGMFPEKLLTYGSDVDTSFASIQTLRQNDGTLKVKLTGWVIVEYGIFINTIQESKTLKLNLMGTCGTVPTKTMKKMTYDYIIARTDEEKIDSLIYHCSNTELKITK